MRASFLQQSSEFWIISVEQHRCTERRLGIRPALHNQQDRAERAAAYRIFSCGRRPTLFVFAH